jgi:NADH-quinone oxidoreductase subunit J
MTLALTNVFFYLAAAIAVVATVFVITGRNPVHALLNLIVSLLAVSGMFFMLGAPFAGVLEVIVYAGAIMVLFVFVVMMLNLGKATIEQERHWLTAKNWIAPAGLAALLLAGLLSVILGGGTHAAGLAEVDAKQVGIVLFGPYLLAVELASMLLLAALVAAYHLGKHD